MPEHGLHAHGSARHPVADHGLAPERELVTGGADYLIGHQAQHGDAAGGVLFPVSRGRGSAIELPADPVGDAGRGQQPVVPPQPAALAAVRPAGPDLHPDAGQPAGGQAGVQPLRERLGGEHHGFGPRFRRIELAGHGQVGGRRPGRERAGVQTAGKPVRGLACVAESAGHIAGRQRGQVTEGAEAELAEQPG